MGDNISETKKTINLKQLSKNSLKRNDKKSGRKKPRPNDCDKEVIPAPDSTAAALEQEDVCDDIPVKKIKLECKEGSDKGIQDEKWVSGLKVSHKENILDPKGWLCSDIVNYSLDIIKKQFEHIHGLQLTNLAPIFDVQTKSWKCDKKFEHTQPPSVQIHHTGRSHWVTSFQNNSNEICILDSLSKSKNQTVNTPSLEIQLSLIYGRDNTSIPIKILDVQQQENSYDCGLFAIANLVEFCFDPAHSFQIKTYFKAEYMRNHLIVECLENGKFTKFPQNSSQISDTSDLKHKIVTIQCCCSCGFPDWVDEMVGCDFKLGKKLCNVWKHSKCADVNNDCTDWLCNDHCRE